MMRILARFFRNSDREANEDSGFGFNATGQNFFLDGLGVQFPNTPPTPLSQEQIFGQQQGPLGPGNQTNGLNGQQGPNRPLRETETGSERPIDGTGTNDANPDWGATGQTLFRLADANFEDGIGEISQDLPNAREISNALAQQNVEDIPNSFGLSDMFWAFGQFIDHDLDLTEEGEEGEFTPISVPVGDPFFDPFGTGEAFIPFTRVTPNEGTGETEPREYTNAITSFLDASMVYGSDAETAAALRTDGGKLLLDENNFLVQTEEGDVLAGDVRAAENVALTSLHTLFVKEHNFWVDQLSNRDPSLSDDELFQAARQRVEAEIQAITFNEFLPLLVGEDAITEYDGYDPTVNPGISLEFATAAFRFGHTLLSPEIQRIDESGNTIEAGDLSLSEAFFSPDEITENGGIDPILRGIADGTASQLDTQLVEDVRSFLFGAPGSGGLDLAALNIERGRDLGVASYNDLREAVGLARAETFSDITSDAALAASLEAVYGDVDLVEAWIGGLAEDPAGDGVLGELFATIILDQFLRIRDGDPFWSENSDLSGRELDALWDTSLADIIERNTDIENIQDNVFISHNRIGGTQDQDTLQGTADADLIIGLAGNDLLFGNEGNDQIEGGSGSDFIDGGFGNDLLFGGAGPDQFAFAGNFGEDIIADYDGQGPGGDTLLIDTDFYTSAQEVVEAAQQINDDVVIDFGEDGSITLENINLVGLQANDITIV